MDKYIDREDLIAWLNRIPLIDLSDGRGFCRVIMEDDFKKAIKKMPKGIIADIAPVQEWISVDDKLPEDDSDVLAYSRIGEESRIYPACYSNGVWFDCVFNAPATDMTTHWMKMPHPPKGE